MSCNDISACVSEYVPVVIIYRIRQARLPVVLKHLQARALHDERVTQ